MSLDLHNPVVRQRLINRRVDPHAEGCTCDDPECHYQVLDPPPTSAEIARWPNELPHEDGCPAWHRGPCICEKDSEHQRIEGLTHIEALDQLNDLVSGLELWHESKTHSDYGAWDKHDEMLWRWIECSEAKDQF